jgi:hypothetical protein
MFILLLIVIPETAPCVGYRNTEYTAAKVSVAPGKLPIFPDIVPLLFPSFYHWSTTGAHCDCWRQGLLASVVAEARGAPAVHICQQNGQLDSDVWV